MIEQVMIPCFIAGACAVLILEAFYVLVKEVVQEFRGRKIDQ